MKLKQLSLFLENRPGQLRAPLEALAAQLRAVDFQLMRRLFAQPGFRDDVRHLVERSHSPPTFRPGKFPRSASLTICWGVR